MTVATTAPNLPVPISGDAAGLSILGDWLAAADNAAQLARMLVRSFFVPAAYKPQVAPRATPEEVADAFAVAEANATGAILLGQSLALDPLTSLQQIYVVHGRPGMYSKMKVALAQRAGHRIWEEEYSPERSTWAGQRAGSEDVVRITLTIEDAKRAGWTSNAAYQKTPADMLAARCSSRVVDRIAADALFGLRSIEDLDDEPAPVAVAAKVSASEILARPAPQIPAAGSAVRQEPTPAAAGPMAERMDGPPLPGEGESSSGVSADPAPMTDRQARALSDLMLGLGIRGPGQLANRRKVMSHVIGRTVDGENPPTEAEAELVIDNLRASGPEVLRQALGSPDESTDARADYPGEAEPAPDAAAAQAEAEATYADDVLPDPTVGGDPWAGRG